MQTQSTLEIPEDTFIYDTKEDPELMVAGDQHRITVGNICHLLARLKLLRPELSFYIGTEIYWFFEERTNKKCVPDIFVVCHVTNPDALRNSWFDWAEGSQGLPKRPNFIIEVASESTYREDLTDKVLKYQALKVQEYFLYGPFASFLETPLIGFRLDNQDKYQPIVANESGEMVSCVLDIDLIPQGLHLKMRDRYTGLMVLTEAEFEAQAKNKEKLRADREAKARKLEKKRAVTHAKARKLEQERADKEAKARAEAELQIQQLKEKLRRAGIDPDQA